MIFKVEFCWKPHNAGRKQCQLNWQKQKQNFLEAFQLRNANRSIINSTHTLMMCIHCLIQVWLPATKFRNEYWITKQVWRKNISVPAIKIKPTIPDGSHYVTVNHTPTNSLCHISATVRIFAKEQFPSCPLEIFFTYNLKIPQMDIFAMPL